MGSFWSKLLSKRKSGTTLDKKALALELDVPIRTLNYRIEQQDKRLVDETTIFLESEAGEQFLKRLVVETIYTFCIKGGIGAGRVEEFFELIHIYSHVAISESSILRILREIEKSILALESKLFKQLHKKIRKPSNKTSKVFMTFDVNCKLLFVCDFVWQDAKHCVSRKSSSTFQSKTPKISVQN
jgi:hypothetical protein